jgi:UDP-N-acetylmuramyl pentapeptide phosphotransferase/UDP-N-acetylglucosamine-1-phosphate transferase
MPGYSGGAMAGFLLGILSILSFGKVGTAVLVLTIPITDAAYTILRRIQHRQSPFKADWDIFIIDYSKSAGENDELQYFTGLSLLYWVYPVYFCQDSKNYLLS